MMKSFHSALPFLALTAAMTLASAGAAAQQGETVRIGWVDSLSGPMAGVGQNLLKTFQFTAERFSQDNPAGVKFEMVPMDSKLSPQESLSALTSLIGQGVRYIAQGSGSGSALAISEAVAKYNERNPGKEVIFLNYGASDPDLTNSKCTYWHFRLDVDTTMKMEVLTTWVKEQPDIRKIYLVNQNYAHGQQVSRFAKDMLARKRSDIQIVGDDLHPIGQTRDFAPYVAKIKASGADTVLTGNWGGDLTLLVKAANEAGLKLRFLTYYANAFGTPVALGPDAAGSVYMVNHLHSNMPGDVGKVMNDFKAKFNEDMFLITPYHMFSILGTAMAKAKSTDPVKVAEAMEGLKFKSFNGEAEMRASDHQLQQGVFMSVWQKADASAPYSMENTGYGFKAVKYYTPVQASTPTSCQMKRPAS